MLHESLLLNTATSTSFSQNQDSVHSVDLLDKLEAQSTDMSNDDTASSKKSGSSAAEISKKPTKKQQQQRTSTVENIAEKTVEEDDKAGDSSSTTEKQQNSRPATPDLRLVRRRSTSSLEMSMRNQLQNKIQKIRGRW